MPKSALSILKEYAETPFTLWDLRGRQFTITEDMPRGKIIREKIERNIKYNRDQTYYYIKVQEGLFEKDLKMSESELTSLFLAMPKDLNNFKGATLTVEQGMTKKLNYIGISTDTMNENFPANKLQDAPGQTIMPTNKADSLTKQLGQALIFNSQHGITTNKAIILQMATNLKPGDPQGLIDAAKAEGWITEDPYGIFRGV